MTGLMFDYSSKKESEVHSTQTKCPRATCKEIETAFAPFLQEVHPKPRLFWGATLANLAYVAAFVITHRHSWSFWETMAASFIILMCLVGFLDSWYESLRDRAWANACKLTWLVLHQRIEHWLERQWLLHYIDRQNQVPGGLPPNYQDDFAISMCEYLQDLPAWLRDRLCRYFSQIRLPANMGTQRHLSHRKRVRILAGMHRQYNNMHSSNNWGLAFLLVGNVAVMIVFW